MNRVPGPETGRGHRAGGKPRLRLSGLDMLLVAILAAGFGSIVWSVRASGGPAWEWRVLGQYIVHGDGRPGLLLQGLFTTIRLTCWSAVIALAQAMENNLLRAEHLLHIRCELADKAVVDMFSSVMDHELLRLVSIMDHTPGQRQWSDLEKYRSFHADKKWTDEELLAEIERLRAVQASHAEPNRETILGLCRERGLPLASHDDTTVEHVEETARLGMGIAEFPTTREAASRARELGLATVLGAPNVVRGASHSGNASALDLATDGLVDILSSDYMPASLLQAPFVMAEKLGLPLHQTLRTVTANPARALGLSDRGELLPGKRADLLRVRMVDDVPVVVAVWREGRQVM